MANTDWHALSVEELSAFFSTDITRGLSEEEAKKRIEKGKNVIPEPKRDTLFKRVIGQIKSPISLVLVFATVAAIFVGTGADAFVIAVALFVNVALLEFSRSVARKMLLLLCKRQNVSRFCRCETELR